MIETLFKVNTSKLTPTDTNTPRPLFPFGNQDAQVLDPKKSQNIAILLRALNVTVDEVCQALLEGNKLSFLLVFVYIVIFIVQTVYTCCVEVLSFKMS